MANDSDFAMDLSFERSFLPTRSSNIKIIADVDGTIDTGRFRTAVHKLAKKHPYLRSKVAMKADGTACLTTAGGKTPEIIIETGETSTAIYDAIYRQDLRPANWEKDATSRFILVKGMEGSDIIIAYIHHVVADGRSVAYVMKHLLECIADANLDIAQLTPLSLVEHAPDDVSIPDVQRSYTEQINAGWAQQKVTFGVEDFINVAKQKYAGGPDVYVDETLSKEETSALRKQSKVHGISVNAALLAAILIAKNMESETPSPNHLGFAVDVRQRLTKDAGEACNLLASGSMVAPDYIEGTAFWTLAEDIHIKTQQALASNQSLFGTRLLTQIMDPTFNDAMYMYQQGKWEGTPMIQQMGGRPAPVGAVLTNLGGMQLPAEYGGDYPVQLRDAIFYPPIGIEKVLEFGASSLLGKLHLVTLSPQGSVNGTLKAKVATKVIGILRENL